MDRDINPWGTDLVHPTPAVYKLLLYKIVAKATSFLEDPDAHAHVRKGLVQMEARHSRSAGLGVTVLLLRACQVCAWRDKISFHATHWQTHLSQILLLANSVPTEQTETITRKANYILHWTWIWMFLNIIISGRRKRKGWHPRTWPVASGHIPGNGNIHGRLCIVCLSIIFYDTVDMLVKKNDI